MEGSLGYIEEKTKGEWDQIWGVRQHIPELVHKGGHQWHCTSADNAWDIHLVRQLGIEPGAERWQHQQCQ